MTEKNLLSPDYLFEVSWEVCNKVGGIYTVIATKALYLKSQLGDHHILIGPDVWMSTDANPAFEEDQTLYSEWKAQAAEEGLRVRIGHWSIPGKPVAILVDFKQMISRMDDILTNLWKDWGVDSLMGNWDYKENTLFGVVAGKVIESFYRHNLSPKDKVVAQFHEWQTGAGLLYIKHVNIPIATVFTTHATVVGRCIAGNDLPLYDNMTSYNGDEMARRFNVVSRHSLEKTTAQNADVFTTVSDITARECSQFLGRNVDFVTPNGFEGAIAPSSEEDYRKKRTAARERLSRVAFAMSGDNVGQNDVFVCIGGRYEYRNKGIDVFLDAFGQLKKKGWAGCQIQAFIMIPGGHNGPDRELAAKLDKGENPDYRTQVSHSLMYPETDQISRRMRELGLDNALGSKIKVYFVPSYLNGDDGIFNMKYYDLLVGMDLALFPSYYEPWGYTPLEAAAFCVPTFTTSLAGFGMWIREHYSKASHPGVAIADRTDANYFDVVNAVVARIEDVASLNDAQRQEYCENAADVASIALWKNQIKYYNRAYDAALDIIDSKRGDYREIKEEKHMNYSRIEINRPTWQSVMVTRHLPKALEGLERLSKNLWWCWNDSAKALFKSVDKEIWHKTGHNPMALLDTVSLKRFNELAKDSNFLGQLAEVMEEFDTYMAAKKDRKDPQIGYFCMEYGLDTSLKIYSGGLGILAGDYLKETSDMNVNLVAVGFLYRYGYFTQVLTAQGDQVARYDAADFMRIPVTPVLNEDGSWVTTSVAFPGRNITARIWKVAVGRTDLYLLDTDYEANNDEDRAVTHQLYGGDWENRLKQELLLGIGGIRALRNLGLNPQIYHCNEGHAAFIGLERLREYIQKENLSFSEALEVVRSSSLFTTHTPVPAGHDAFDEGLLRKYLGHEPDELKISWEAFMALGKHHPEDPNEKFSMSILAANISQNVNGVSKLHGEVSRKIFADMYPGYLPEELHIGYVTNGVHYPTWASKEWKKVHAPVFGAAFKTSHYDKSCFEGIYRVPDEVIWNTRKLMKQTLINVVKEKISDPSQCSHYSPSQIVTIKETLRDDVLTIGFARRFATYKRATLLFKDLDRLDAIVNNPERPVQFFFAGKAHPADKAGQDLIKQIVEISKQDRFIGKIVFIPGYDITLAKRLVQGVDVWMNNPTRPLEASGTSGEKAAMNGVMHFSVLDGWWVEGYRPGAGWALPQERTYDDQNYQDELDAATIYSTIENEIAPDYYDKDEKTGMSTRWIGYIKNTIAQVASNFTTNRMLTDYCNQYYNPQYARTMLLQKDDYKVAREIAAWKKHVESVWPHIQVLSYTQPNASYSVSPTDYMHAEVVLNIGDLNPEDIGVEMLFCTTDRRGELHIQDEVEFNPGAAKDGIVTYSADILPERTGMYHVATRYYAKDERLPHRQDFPLVKWL